MRGRHLLMQPNLNTTGQKCFGKPGLLLSIATDLREIYRSPLTVWSDSGSGSRSRQGAHFFLSFLRILLHHVEAEQAGYRAVESTTEQQATRVPVTGLTEVIHEIEMLMDADY